jgi:hypothetical protein
MFVRVEVRRQPHARSAEHHCAGDDGDDGDDERRRPVDTGLDRV